MRNIASNAVEYRKPNTPTMAHIKAIKLRGGAARLSIADNGVGFGSKYATMIFEPFGRHHS